MSVCGESPGSSAGQCCSGHCVSDGWRQRSAQTFSETCLHALQDHVQTPPSSSLTVFGGAANDIDSLCACGVAVCACVYVNGVCVCVVTEHKRKLNILYQHSLDSCWLHVL